MTDDMEIPPRGYDTKDVPAQPGRKRLRRWLWMTLVVLVVAPGAVFSLWTALALGFTFSTGERAGYVQKLSKRGWLCKTWEGELAMVNLPGTAPEIFEFSVRSDSVAEVLEGSMGKRVSISYAQHKGVPTSCFGDTEYFITRVRLVDP
jgi:hypothetical protein